MTTAAAITRALRAHAYPHCDLRVAVTDGQIIVTLPDSPNSRPDTVIWHMRHIAGQQCTIANTERWTRNGQFVRYTFTI